MAKRVLGIGGVLILLALGAWWLLTSRPDARPAAVAPRESLQELAERSEDVALRETETETVVEIGDVLFDFDRAEIRPDGEQILEVVVGFLQTQPGQRVRIHGHTDAIGTEAYNQALSLRRAQAVRRWLTAHGVAPGRLTVQAWGESLPVASNATSEGRRLNRRVEIALQRGS